MRIERRGGIPLVNGAEDIRSDIPFQVARGVKVSDQLSLVIPDGFAGRKKGVFHIGNGLR